MPIYLVRHGKAVSSSIDAERPLSIEGKDELDKFAKIFQPARLEIEEIYYSVKLRAKQTACIYASYFAPNAALIEREGLSPEDPASLIYQELLGENKNIMVVGHLPFLDQLIECFFGCKCPISFKEGHIVCLESSFGHYELSWSLFPDLFFTNSSQSSEK